MLTVKLLLQGETCGIGLAIFLIIMIIFVALNILYHSFDDDEEEHVKTKNKHIKK